MANSKESRESLLLAVWPGMGSVAVIAGSYLQTKLSVEGMSEIDPHPFFELRSVDVHQGLVRSAQLPRSRLFEWKDPHRSRDLMLFMGEAQPTHRAFRLCRQLVRRARNGGVRQVFTFAAMATAMELGSSPRTLVAATDAVSLSEAIHAGAELLGEGQISGLNGLLLAAAADEGLRATCLLGEIPYFATGFPCPRASQAVLKCFTALAEISIDLKPLLKQAEAVEERLQQMVQELKLAGGVTPLIGSEEDAIAAQEIPLETSRSKTLDPSTQSRIEALFEAARHDRMKAVELKQELDRLGVFKQFENQFLDLFRKDG